MPGRPAFFHQMNFPSKLRYFCIFYPFQLAGLCFVIIPFVRFNNLMEWDFPGHYASIWHLKTYLLPWYTGWNPFFYCGYPHGVFYPPLAHYVAALLSFPLGVAGAIKLMVSASIVLLPAIFYFFSRRWGLNDFQAAVCSTWMTALLFLSGDMFGTQPFGSDLKSILNVGLFANAVSLPVLFLFAGCCGGENPVRRWKLPALLLGLLILIHPLSALIAGIFLLSLCIIHLISRAPSRSWNLLLKILGIGFLLGSPWLIPFLWHRSYMNPEFIGADWSPALLFVIINGMILAISSFSKAHLRPLILSYVILVNFIVVGNMWRLELQFARLTIYLLFLIPIFLFTWLKSRVLIISTGLLAMAVGAYGYFSSGINPKGVADFPLPDFGRVQGRILAVSPPSHLPSYHVNQDPIPIKTRNEAILGLFIESSLNGRFAGNLTRLLEPDAYVWGTPTENLKHEWIQKNYPSYVFDRLRLFGISHIYTDLKLEDTLDPGLVLTKRYVNSYPAPKLESEAEAENLRRRYNVRGNLLDFYLYPVGAGSLTEVLPYVPKNPPSDWKTTNRIWFTQTKGVPIFTDRPAPANARAANTGEWVEVLERSENSERVSLQIHAEQDIPVLVKMGFFPNWRLKIDGKAAPIYRASPNLILFFGKGHAVLEYRRSWQEYLGLLLSACGVVLLISLRK